MSKRKGMSKKLRLKILNRDESTCQLCGSKAPDVVIHVDHIVPVSKGGKDIESNLQCLCESCNLAKSNRVVLHINSPIEVEKQNITEWLRIKDLSKLTGIAESTIRYYLNFQFRDYFFFNYERRYRRIHVSGIGRLKIIRSMFQKGYDTCDILDFLDTQLGIEM